MWMMFDKIWMIKLDSTASIMTERSGKGMKICLELNLDSNTCNSVLEDKGDMMDAEGGQWCGRRLEFQTG